MEREPTARMLYPMDEAAALCGLKRTSLYRLVNEGKLQRVHIGRRHSSPPTASPATSRASRRSRRLMSSSDRPHAAGRTSAFSVPQPGWTLTHRRAEVMDILARSFAAQADSKQTTEYDPRPISELHAAVGRALKLDEAAHEVTRPLCNREIAELLAERFGKRDAGDAAASGEDASEAESGD